MALLSNSYSQVPEPFLTDASPSPARIIAVWLFCSIIALIAAMNFLHASYKDGVWHPVGNDSFYHAARVLDTVEGERGFYQFDDRIHVPEGSWITWPWAYDYAVAAIVKGVTTVSPDTDPMAVAASIAPAWLFINLGLLLAIALRIGLPLELAALVATAFALSPLTQMLHGVGQLDHHFIEHFFVLLAVLTGLRWLQEPSRSTSIALGAALGLAPAFHNGLFILQLPLLVALALLWFRGSRPSRDNALTFAAMLLATTLIALLPSGPFRDGQFAFYTHSSFHLYVAFCTGALVILFSTLQFNRKNLLLGIGISALLAVPALPQFVASGEYLGVELVLLDRISEMRSPLEWYTEPGGAAKVAREYSALIWLVPLLLLLYLQRGYEAFKKADAPNLFFNVSLIFGLLLLLLQYRLHYFGSQYLLLGWLIVVNELRLQKNLRRKLVFLVSFVALIAVYQPVVPGKLFMPHSLSGDPFYDDTHALFDTLAERCADRPGLVLTTNDAGHQTTFHTDCPVLANNFMMTAQHQQKVVELHELLEMSPEQALAAQPETRYIMARLQGVYSVNPDGTIGPTSQRTVKANTQRLFYELVFRTDLPDNIRLIATVPLDDDRPYPAAALYEVVE